MSAAVDRVVRDRDCRWEAGYIVISLSIEH